MVDEAPPGNGLGSSASALAARTLSFDEGFCFAEPGLTDAPPAESDPAESDPAGTDPAGPDLAEVVGSEPVAGRSAEPTRRVVYVARQGHRVHTARGRLLVESPDGVVALDVPLGGVARVVCCGAVGVSAGLRAWALRNDVEIVYCTFRGRYLGHTQAEGSGTRVRRLREQLAFADDERACLAVGRAIVAAKIRKQLVVVRRLARSESAEAVAQACVRMQAATEAVPGCADREELMGLEGSAARAYFSALSQLVPAGLGFSGRSRRPPRDVVNAALSFGYAVLLGEAVTAVRAAGLDPAIGVFHAEHETRPSLALDLIEEFRPLVVDQAVIVAFRRQDLRPEHGQGDPEDGGVLLDPDGRRAFFAAYEQRMLQVTGGALPGFTGSWRRHLYRQAERLGAAIRSRDTPWTGLAWR
jgi:CRISP-associated protein Cas1